MRYVLLAVVGLTSVAFALWTCVCLPLGPGEMLVHTEEDVKFIRRMLTEQIAELEAENAHLPYGEWPADAKQMHHNVIVSRDRWIRKYPTIVD